MLQQRYINDLDVVLLCGGNTTIKHGNKNEEKLQCMIYIERRPLLLYIIDQVSAFGANKAIIALNKDSKNIRKFLGRKYALVNFSYSYEDFHLGTGGATKQAITNFGDRKDVLIIECNSYTNYNIFDMRKFLEQYEKNSKLCSLSYNNNEHILSEETINTKLYQTGIYLADRDYLLSLPDKCSLKYDIKDKDHYILNGDHNKTIDIGLHKYNFKLMKSFFREIWGYDWSRYDVAEDIKTCQNCLHAHRITIRKNIYHAWKRRCSLINDFVGILSSCEYFKLRSKKPYVRAGKANGNEEA